MHKFIRLLVLGISLNYPAHAEKAMPEIGIDLMRNLSTKGGERLQVYCPVDPKEKCVVNETRGELRIAEAEVSREKAGEWVQGFYLKIPAADVKKRTRQEAMANGPEVSNSWFVMKGDFIAYGQIKRDELAKLTADQKKRAEALAALELKIRSVLKK